MSDKGFAVDRVGNKQRLRDVYACRFSPEVLFLECYVAEKIVNSVMGRNVGTHMLKLGPKDYVEFLQRAGMDAAYLYEGWFLGRKNKIDAKGQTHYIDGTIKSRNDFDQIIPPPLARVERRIESFLEAA